MAQNCFNTVKEILDRNNKEYSNGINSLLECVQDEQKNFSKNILKFVDKTCVEYSKEKQKVCKKHPEINWDHGDSLFELVSDNYQKEDLHSDLLFALLDPEPKGIWRPYNFCYLKNFLKTFGIPTEKFKPESYSGSREEYAPIYNKNREEEKRGRIDIYLENTNNKQAIIIENKINGASDMPNQLARYYKYAVEEKKIPIENVIVIYLSLTGEKQPPVEDYDTSYRYYTNRLQPGQDISCTNNLKVIKAVAEENSLVHFLENCKKDCVDELEKELGSWQGSLSDLFKEKKEDKSISERTKDIKPAVTALVFLEQYKNLLEHLGGQAYMSSADENIIKKIFSDQEKLQAAMDFAELWNDKKREAEAFNNLSTEDFKLIFNENEFSSFEKITLYDYPVHACKSNKNKCYVYVWMDKDAIQVGYCSFDNKKGFPEDQIKKLENVLQSELVLDAPWLYCSYPINQASDMDTVKNALKILLEA